MTLAHTNLPASTSWAATTSPIAAAGHTSSVGLQVWFADQGEDLHQWLACWEAWPQREVFAHPSYLGLFKSPTDRVACVSYQSDAGCGLYSFLLRDLTGESVWRPGDGPAADLVVPFSYGGPYAWNVADSDAFAEEFWQAFDQWGEQVGLVSEFARLPLFADRQVADSEHCELRQQNVVRSLEPDAEEIWMDLRPKIRNAVRRAQKSGVTVECDMSGERLDDFLRIYWGTMDRLEAQDHYYLDREFFERFRDEIRGQYALFHAMYEGQVVASDLILISADTIYYLLGGTDAEYFKLRPNDLLKHEIMVWAKQAGKRNYVFGGGVTPDDGVFKYKLAFAPSGAVDFCLRKRIVQPERYRLFTERRQEQKQAAGEPTVDPGFFPAYRG